MRCDSCEGKHFEDCKQLGAECIYYNINDVSPSQLLCFLNITSTSSLKQILEELDSKLCEYLSVNITDCFRDALELEPEETLSLSEFLVSLQNYICQKSDEKVKASANDPNAGYLYDKITVGKGLSKTIHIDEHGNRSVHITINPSELYDQIKDLIDIPNCYEVNCASCEEDPDCAPQPLVPVIIKNTNEEGKVILSCSNCNGIITWKNEDGDIVGYGENVLVSGGTYTATSQTVCGTSDASEPIVIPPYTVYTYTRKTNFTRNNCGNNGCGMQCVGTSVEFSKTYTSYISQAHAQQLANSDAQYPIEGQNYANLTGQCNCPSCDCTPPIFANYTTINPTCTGSTLNSNGSVTITGIENANKFGISIGGVVYSGQNYTNAYQLGYTGGNISSNGNSITISNLSAPLIRVRLFNNEDACYTDLSFKLDIPTCSSEGEVEIGDVTISCSI